jgi:hypothetical protein
MGTARILLLYYADSCHPLQGLLDRYVSYMTRAGPPGGEEEMNLVTALLSHCYILLH